MLTLTRNRFVRALAVLMSLSIHGAAIADTITLLNGEVVKGRIVKRSEGEIVVDTMVHNVRTQRKVFSSEVKELVEEPVPDDFFAHPAKAAQSPPNASAAAPVRTSSPPLRKPTPYLTIPLQGGFGEDFDEHGIEEVLAFASQNRVHHVLFELDSTGGAARVGEAMSKVLTKYEHDIEFSIKIHRAISASVWVVVMCPHVYFTPVAQLGAAVAYDGQADGAVTAKMNSAWNSIICSLADGRSRIPPAVIRAMGIMDAQLWSATNRATGRIELFDSEPDPTKYDGIELVDSDKQVLTLTGAQAIHFGIGEPWPPTDGRFQAPEWKEYNQFGQRAMERCRERLHDRRRAIEMVVKLPEFVKQAQVFRHPDTYSDYPIEPVREMVAGVIRTTLRRTAEGDVLYERRMMAFTNAWTTVLRGCDDAERMAKRASGPWEDLVLKALFDQIHEIRVEVGNAMR